MSVVCAIIAALLIDISRLGAGVQNISTTQMYGVFIIDPTNANVLASTGTGLNGGYAEFVLVNQAQLIPVVRSSPSLSAICLCLC